MSIVSSEQELAGILTFCAANKIPNEHIKKHLRECGELAVMVLLQQLPKEAVEAAYRDVLDNCIIPELLAEFDYFERPTSIEIEKTQDMLSFMAEYWDEEAAIQFVTSINNLSMSLPAGAHTDERLFNEAADRFLSYMVVDRYEHSS